MPKPLFPLLALISALTLAGCAGSVPPTQPPHSPPERPEVTVQPQMRCWVDKGEVFCAWVRYRPDGTVEQSPPQRR